MNELIQLLGQSEKQVIEASPFEKWEYVKSVSEDLPEHMTRIYYTFVSKGVELSFDMAGRLVTIFLHSDEYGGFQDFMGNVDFDLTRSDVLERYGTPTKQGEQRYFPDLGKIGAYDRFDYASYALHFRYFFDQDRIEMITLMSIDVAP